jgi:hypothetical protein
MPLLEGQSSREVPSHAELLGRLVPVSVMTKGKMETVVAVAVKEGEPDPYNVLMLKGTRQFIAKWQGVHSAPSAIVAPTMSKLLDILYAQKKET